MPGTVFVDLRSQPPADAAPGFDPAAWAAACREEFAHKQPHLVGEVWDDVWQAVPYGHRLWVVALKRLDKFGSIIIPDQAKRAHQEGWIVSVGPSVCDGEPSGFRPTYNNPFDYVGRRVFWGAYCGIDLVPTKPQFGDEVPLRNRPTSQQYLSLSIADVMGESLRTDGSIL